VPASHESIRPGRVVVIARWALVAAAAALATFSAARAAGLFDRALVRGDYVCPMHPEVTSDQPGVCPVCRMRLERAPRRAAPSADGQVTAAAAPASTVQARRKQVARELTAPAVIAVPDAQLVSVSARAEGWIATLPVAEVGRRVERGQVLATLDSPELFRAQQKFLNAVRWSGSGAPNIQPSHDGDSTGDLVAEARLQLGLAGIAEADIAALRAEGRPRHAVAVRAPIDGVVVRKQAERGGFASVGQELFAIADLGTVWAVAEVPQGEVGRLRIGGRARVDAPAGAPVDGAIAAILPTVDEGSRTVRVRVAVPNGDGALRPGMAATVHVAGEPAAVQVVPATSVVDLGSRSIVFVVRAGRREARQVVLGARAGDEVEVVSGLGDGDMVVSQGAFLLEAESRQRAARPTP
jgi:membrane fusion protein, copper/silver efflux system